ncbi:MAG: hypothetical protein ABIJ97_09665, partial [Bacteroidota bacterium]
EDFTPYGKQIVQIQFVDTISKKINNVFDIRENNPYVFDASFISQKPSFDTLYQLNVSKFKSIPGLTYIKEYKDYIDSLGNEIYASIYIGIYSKNTNYTIVGYWLHAYSDNALIGYSNCFLVLDNYGKIYKPLTYINEKISVMPTITGDGKYLIIGYGGGLADENLIRFENIGYMIFDLQLDKKFNYVLERKKYNDVGPFIWDNGVICIEVSTYTRQCLLIVLDLENKYIYSKEYSREKRSLMKSVEKDHVIFYTDPEKTQTYSESFSEQFQKQELKK